MVNVYRTKTIFFFYSHSTFSVKPILNFYKIQAKMALHEKRTDVMLLLLKKTEVTICAHTVIVIIVSYG